MKIDNLFKIRNVSLRGLAFALVMALTAFFLFSYFKNETLEQKNVLGEKKSNGVDTRQLVEEAADDLADGRPFEAEKKLKTVLEFKPANSYALAMMAKVSSNSQEIEFEINKTLEILTKQPDWQEAWFRLADLYERSGQAEMADYARGKAKVLKTT